LGKGRQLILANLLIVLKGRIQMILGRKYSVSPTLTGKRWDSKGTLHYMKKNAEADKPFTLNSHVKERLEMWE
jgi:CRISPR-associated protein Cas1